MERVKSTKTKSVNIETLPLPPCEFLDHLQMREKSVEKGTKKYLVYEVENGNKKLAPFVTWCSGYVTAELGLEKKDWLEQVPVLETESRMGVHPSTSGRSFRIFAAIAGDQMTWQVAVVMQQELNVVFQYLCRATGDSAKNVYEAMVNCVQPLLVSGCSAWKIRKKNACPAELEEILSGLEETNSRIQKELLCARDNANRIMANLNSMNAHINVIAKPQKLWMTGKDESMQRAELEAALQFMNIGHVLPSTQGQAEDQLVTGKERERTDMKGKQQHKEPVKRKCTTQAKCSKLHKPALKISKSQPGGECIEDDFSTDDDFALYDCKEKKPKQYTATKAKEAEEMIEVDKHNASGFAMLSLVGIPSDDFEETNKAFAESNVSADQLEKAFLEVIYRHPGSSMRQYLEGAIDNLVVPSKRKEMMFFDGEWKDRQGNWVNCYTSLHEDIMVAWFNASRVKWSHGPAKKSLWKEDGWQRWIMNHLKEKNDHCFRKI